MTEKIVGDPTTLEWNRTRHIYLYLMHTYLTTNRELVDFNDINELQGILHSILCLYCKSLRVTKNLQRANIRIPSLIRDNGRRDVRTELLSPVLNYIGSVRSKCVNSCISHLHLSSTRKRKVLEVPGRIQFHAARHVHVKDVWFYSVFCRSFESHAVADGFDEGLAMWNDQPIKFLAPMIINSREVAAELFEQADLAFGEKSVFVCDDRHYIATQKKLASQTYDKGLVLLDRC